MRTALGHPVVRTVALAGAAAALLAACSSSGGAGTTSTSPVANASAAGGASSAAGSPAPTGSPIKIGMIASLTGPQATSTDQAGTVAPAWAAWVNANGGINGHPVQVIAEDDGGDPAKAQAAEKTLVDQDNVLAIVIGSDNLLPAFDGDAISKGVPLIAGAGNSADWYQKAGMFSTVTDVVSGLADQMLVAVQVGHAKHFANIYCSEVAACAQATQLQTPIAKKMNLKYSALAVSATATSYTAQCLQLQQEGADYVQMNINSGSASKFIQDCQAQNYNPTWGTSEQAVGTDLLKLSNATMYGPAYVFPSVGNSPAVQTFTAAMTKYAKGDNWKEGTASFAWVGFQALRDALAHVGASPTRKDVVAALNSLKDDDLGGLVPNKVTFTAGKPVPFGGHPCSFVVGIKDGKTVAPNGLTPLCPSA